MTMHWRNVPRIVVLGMSLLLATGLGKGDTAIVGGSEGAAKHQMNTTSWAYMKVAQKGKRRKTAEKESTQTPKKDHTESEGAKATTSKDRTRTSFKDFVPSEKIPGDSAVDFPTDI